MVSQSLTVRHEVGVRILLFILGCVLTAGFWNGVFASIEKQRAIDGKWSVRLSEKDRSLYRIVALGESTTQQLSEAPAWPELLESELNTRVGFEKFRVINLGMSGTTSSRIVKEIDTVVSMYKPDMVISMMGINDVNFAPFLHVPVPYGEQMLRYITESKLYRFASIMTRLIIGKNEQALLKQAAQCDDDAMGDDDWASIMTNSSYITDVDLLSFVKRYPFSYHSYEMLVAYYVRSNKWKEARYWVAQTKKMEPYMRFCAVRVSGNFKELKHQPFMYIDNTMTYIHTMHVLIEKAMGYKYTFDARQYFTSESLDRIDTAVYYPMLSTFLHGKDIVHVAMQYPMFPITQLQHILRNQSNVFFVSNEENFQRALQTYTYSDLFVDHFGGVFGHPTQLGSQLIAQQAAGVVLELTHDKK